MVVAQDMLSCLKTRESFVVQPGLLLGLILLVSCTKRVTPGGVAGGSDAGPAPNSSSSHSDASVGPSACRAPAKGASFTLGASSREGETKEGEVEVDEELPFSTTLGNAIALNDRYWVTAVDYRSRESHAVIAKIENSVDRGTTIDLGRVFGDAEPPRIAAYGTNALFVVPDSDASGRTLKVGRLTPSPEKDRIEWIDSVLQGIDDSPVFSIATNQATAVIAWDELDASSRRGIVRFRAIVPSTPNAVAMPSSQVVSSTQSGRSNTPFPMKRLKTINVPKNELNVQSTDLDIDAEAPQLVPRASGFWLGYLVNERRNQLERSAVNASSNKRSSEDKNEERPVVELGKRGIQIMALDSSAKASGRPIVVTAPGAHVVAFEIKGTADGGALVAYRDATSSPGVEEDIVEIAEVHPDGSIERIRLEDERVGVGAPSLWVSSKTQEAERVWLMVAGKSGEMQVMSHRMGEGRISPPMTDPLLLGAEPLLRDGAMLLVSRAKGRAVEFERLECRFDELSQTQNK
jgi:hypothetical protein